MEIQWKVTFRAKNCISHTYVVTLLYHTGNENQGTFKESLLIMIIKHRVVFYFFTVLLNPMSLKAALKKPRENKGSLGGKNHMTLKQLVAMLKILNVK